MMVELICRHIRGCGVPMRLDPQRGLTRHPLTCVIAVCLVISSCTTSGSLAPDWRQDLAYKSSDRVDACIGQFKRFDQAAKRKGVRDAETARIVGFPYLRVNRFLSSFREQDLTSGQFETWLDSMRRLDQDARFVEAQNMGGSPVPLARLDQCADTLLQADRRQEYFEPSLRRAAIVPDHYSFWRRLAGLYPVTNLAAAFGYRSWKRENLEAFENFSDADSSIGPTYQPADMMQNTPKAMDIIAQTPRNRLGALTLSESQRRGLLSAFAPNVRVGSDHPEDQIGHPVWMQDGMSEKIGIDTSRPVTFGRIAHTYWKGEPVLQLVYTIWFSERPKSGRWDLLGGSLDGLVWRVTLDQRGRPVVYDTIHPCGCYHLFFPAPNVVRHSLPEDSDLRESILVVSDAPDIGEDQRIRLTLAPGSHYLIAVDAVSRNPSGVDVIPYQLVFGDRVPDQALRLLPSSSAQGTRSIYGEEGLIAQSERLERWILWPMGIESAGAMRQWGTHATAFVGMRHFDDPYLMEQSFE